MSTYQQERLTAASEKRLSVLVHDIANLNLQLCELYKLRDRVRQAELSARKSRRKDKSKHRDEIHGQAAL
jgi:hypothetical protein